MLPNDVVPLEHRSGAVGKVALIDPMDGRASRMAAAFRSDFVRDP
jgi:hypothetical protein